MDVREEARIGCAIMMLGTSLATLSSLTGLGFIGRADAVQTLVIGGFVLAMVAGAGAVLVNGDRISSLLAAVAGAASALVGWVLIGHQFLWAFPGVYVATALVSLACAKKSGPAPLTGR